MKGEGEGEGEGVVGCGGVGAEVKEGCWEAAGELELEL